MDREAFSLNVALDVPPGITAVLGPNGSGKSTLLHALTGLVDARGYVELSGHTLLDTSAGVCMPVHKRQIGIVFQDLRLFPHLTVQQNIAYGGGLPSGEHLEMLQLGDTLHRYPRSLSRGQQQRVALARTIARKPQALLFDEALSAIDPMGRRLTLRWLKRFVEDSQIPTLFVTHRMSDACALTDRLLLVANGRRAGSGNIDALLHHPQSVRLMYELGIDNVIDATAGPFWCTPIRLPPNDGDDARQVAVQPQDIVLAADEDVRTSARNMLRGRVMRVVDVGTRRLVIVEGLADSRTLIAEVTQEAVDDLALRAAGDRSVPH